MNEVSILGGNINQQQLETLRASARAQRPGQEQNEGTEEANVNIFWLLHIRIALYSSLMS